MSCLDRIQDNTVAKTGIYALYVLGGSFFVGLYRAAITIYYIAQHTFNAEAYRGVYEAYKKELQDKANERLEQEFANKRNRTQENRQTATQARQSERDYEKAKQNFQQAKGVRQNFSALLDTAGAWHQKNVGQMKKVAVGAKNNLVTKVETATNGLLDLRDDLKGTVMETMAGSFEEIEKAKMQAWKEEGIRAAIELIPIIGGLIYTVRDFSDRRVSPLGLQELAYAQAIDDLTDTSSITGLKQLFKLR